MNKRILVADDDPAILDAMSIMLEESGYDVETTVDGAVAQNMSQTMQADLPDLLLLDIRMSGMDGGKICQHLKSAVSTKHIPVILISANKDIEQIALACGADSYIPKPFQMNNLLSLVAKYINKH